MQFFDVFYFILLLNEVSQMQLLEYLKLSWYVIRPFISQWITIKSTLFVSTSHDKTHRFDMSTFWMFLVFLLQNGKCNSHICESPVEFFSNTVQEGVIAKTQFNYCKATLKSESAEFHKGLCKQLTLLQSQVPSPWVDSAAIVTLARQRIFQWTLNIPTEKTQTVLLTSCNLLSNLFSFFKYNKDLFFLLA